MSLWGYQYSLKYLNIINLSSLKFKDIIITKKQSNISIIRYRGWQRIGPHNFDIISLIFGSLLGDGHAEKRIGGVGTRITFYQEDSHYKYILWLHNYLSTRGYCNNTIPILSTRLGKKGKVRRISRFRTWTYTSFNWIHDIWYNEGVKKIPVCIGEYLTPLALAIWIMDDGSKVGKGLKLCTNSFSYEECLLLKNVLDHNFSLKVTVHSAGFLNKDQYVIYIWKESMPLLRKLINDLIIPEMKYKIF
jgi:ubiquinol-cytochrome c reductase cytochrome b subunit